MTLQLHIEWVGKQIGNYWVDQEIGAGGWGRVYRARHITLDDRTVVIKVLRPEVDHDHSAVERFKNEARATARIQHPGVVRIDDVGFLPPPASQHYIVMEYLRGVDLFEWLQRKAPRHEGLALSEVLAFAYDAADALDAAHELGILHRDLKLPNLFRQDEGPLKILDWGIAKLRPEMTGGFRTATNIVLATPGTSPPEQFDPDRKDRIDRRADVFSLAASLYVLIANAEPWDWNHKNPFNYISQVNSMPPREIRAFRPEVPATWAEGLARALSKDPDDRPESAGALVRILIKGLRGGEKIARSRAAAIDAARRFAPSSAPPQSSNVPLVRTRDEAIPVPLPTPVLPVRAAADEPRGATTRVPVAATDGPSGSAAAPPEPSAHNHAATHMPEPADPAGTAALEARRDRLPTLVPLPPERIPTLVPLPPERIPTLVPLPPERIPTLTYAPRIATEADATTRLQAVPALATAATTESAAIVDIVHDDPTPERSAPADPAPHETSPPVASQADDSRGASIASASGTLSLVASAPSLEPPMAAASIVLDYAALLETPAPPSGPSASANEPALAPPPSPPSAEEQPQAPAPHERHGPSPSSRTGRRRAVAAFGSAAAASLVAALLLIARSSDEPPSAPARSASNVQAATLALPADGALPPSATGSLPVALDARTDTLELIADAAPSFGSDGSTPVVSAAPTDAGAAPAPTTPAAPGKLEVRANDITDVTLLRPSNKYLGTNPNGASVPSGRITVELRSRGRAATRTILVKPGRKALLEHTWP